jgi:hypothetical protein
LSPLFVTSDGHLETFLTLFLLFSFDRQA